ncbi:MAG: BON domain-containing protein [Thermoguttaceae bacterium]
MRDNRQGAFVGADAADTGFVGAASSDASGGSRNSRSMRRGGGGSSRGNANQRGGRGGQEDEIRSVLQLGFIPPNPASVMPSRAPAAVASELAGRMERSTRIQKLSPLQVSIAQGTATLRGSVATEHDRLLAERLVLLEPGIGKVENLLQVPSAQPAQEVPALLQPMPENE